MTKKEPTPQNDQEIEDFELEVGITQVNLKGEPRPISEVLDEVAPQGEKRKLEEILGLPINIVGLRAFRGQYGPALFVLFTDDNGELFNTVLGQKVLMPKLLAVQDHLPVRGTIIKREGGEHEEYYDIE